MNINILKTRLLGRLFLHMGKNALVNVKIVGIALTSEKNTVTN